MPSAALEGFRAAVEEVEELTRASPSDRTLLAERTARNRVVGRACIVLLTSHFERYVYSVNEDAVEFVNSSGVVGEKVPEALRLVHSRETVNALERTYWERRAVSLSGFIQQEAWLWKQGETGALVAGKLLSWMKSPSPQNLIRYYRYWGIRDIFEAITRRPQTRTVLFLLVQELVDKRNNIAHGDVMAQATLGDIRRYINTAREFARRADRVFGRELGRLVGEAAPW